MIHTFLRGPWQDDPLAFEQFRVTTWSAAQRRFLSYERFAGYYLDIAVRRREEPTVGIRLWWALSRTESTEAR